ncbi:MAG: histidine phosphatase family protein [Deltaproteobacteria bacterium]|nr:histidine phosphatase family protein [Deltaproteobacteria bacterium]
MSGTGPLLIRHAESHWNAEGRWQGHGDPPLSDRGVAQANALASELASEAIDVIVSSDLRRAAETAAILASARGLRPLLNPRLREIDIGAWQGLTRGQIERTAGDALRRFDGGDLEVRPGGGENLREMQRRAHSAVSELIDTHPGRRLAIVTHLGVIRALCGESFEFDPGVEAALGNASWRYLARGRLFDSVTGRAAAPIRLRGTNL